MGLSCGGRFRIQVCSPSLHPPQLAKINRGKERNFLKEIAKVRTRQKVGRVRTREWMDWGKKRKERGGTNTECWGWVPRFLSFSLTGSTPPSSLRPRSGWPLHSLSILRSSPFFTFLLALLVFSSHLSGKAPTLDPALSLCSAGLCPGN